MEVITLFGIFLLFKFTESALGRMAAIFKAGIPAALRYNITCLWQNTLLFCPRSNTLIGDQNLVKKIQKHKPRIPMGVATPQANTLQHTFIATDDSSDHWFDFWTRERRFWWKLYTFNRDRIIDTRIDADNYEIKYIDEKLGERKVETVQRVTSQSDVLIKSRIDLGIAVESLLHDAYSDPTDVNCCRLHYKLTPYQVSVTMDSPVLQPEATEMIEKLRQLSVRCLPKVNVRPEEPIELVNEFSIEDSLGVFFNVLLEGRQGPHMIVKVRNRDTATSESLYYPQVAPTLAKYLKTEAVPTLDFSQPEKKTRTKEKRKTREESSLSEIPEEFPASVVSAPPPPTKKKSVGNPRIIKKQINGKDSSLKEE